MRGTASKTTVSMRQLISNLKTGEIQLEVVPSPSVEPGHLLIETRRTLVSQGTEKMLLKFGKASLFQKARSQPARVKEVFGKIRNDGLVPTLEAVFRKLDEPLQLGNSNAGIVVGIGTGVAGFRVGDRVASNGPHAEVVSVPQNLVARIPETVSFDSAAFTVIGAIGLQGVRLAKPELGETIVVIGLGLIGQITIQLLRASGCRVIGIDFDKTKVDLAKTFGVDAIDASGERNIVREVHRLTGGTGCDGVIITASSESNQVISQAAQMSRKRGRIILVGVVGLDINRADFYEKELIFQVSCSYGPGRYDDVYEEKGFDYPFPFVRWTENRNFQATLEAMDRGILRVEPLITRRHDLENFRDIYDNMDAAGLASLIVFGKDQGKNHETGTPNSSVVLNARDLTASTLKLSERFFGPSDSPLAIIGAGNFTKMTVLPALRKARIPIKAIVSATGVSSTALAQKYGIPYSSTDYSTILADDEVKGVLITSRHNLHAAQTIAAVKAGKKVLVEKPLCLKPSELGAMGDTLQRTSNGAWVSVGFNRRFSPHVNCIKNLINSSSAPISMIATINAGMIAPGHWVHDPEVGGGRLLGEACHFIDLAIFLTGSLITAVAASDIGGASDSASILLHHDNGSTSVVNYLANGNRELSKERLEVHSDGRSLLLDNFRELRGFGFRSFSSLSTKQDKGHARQFALFWERVKSGGPPLIPWIETLNSARAAIAVQIAITEQRWVAVNEV
jgi:predicted dehydrogenase/threonine dehydrogenase-like Zn-dependent dehydrogenase